MDYDLSPQEPQEPRPMMSLWSSWIDHRGLKSSAWKTVSGLLKKSWEDALLLE